MSLAELVRPEIIACLEHRAATKKLLENPILERDTWHIGKDINLKNREHHRYLTLNFYGFSHEWLKLLLKVYILVSTNPNTPVGSVQHYIVALRKFSEFLQENVVYSAEQISDQVFAQFEQHLNSKGLQRATIKTNLIYLSGFFEYCCLEGWLNVNTYWFKGRFKNSTYGSSINRKKNYIPEEVWNQLEQNLCLLPESIQRMVLVLKALGLRIGELCNLPLNCLIKRENQWRLRLLTEKYDIEDELPISSPELVAVIKEQQSYIKNTFGEHYSYLFCGGRGKKMEFTPKPVVMSLPCFNDWLNKLALESKICSKTGDIWHFTSHQFRHTVATVMTNSGVRDLVIQKYLRHRSPGMLEYYTHLFKEVLVEEYEELLNEKKFVDITGKVVSSYKAQHPITELLRRKMHQISTQYGECHRSVLKEPCKTINACWSCEHWRTSTDDLSLLEGDLERVEEELVIAEQLGMVRQYQGLEDDRDRLSIRIKGLKEIDG